MQLRHPFLFPYVWSLLQVFGFGGDDLRLLLKPSQKKVKKSLEASPSRGSKQQMAAASSRSICRAAWRSCASSPSECNASWLPAGARESRLSAWPSCRPRNFQMPCRNEVLELQMLDLAPLMRIAACGLSGWICLSRDLDSMGKVQREEALGKAGHREFQEVSRDFKGF